MTRQEIIKDSDSIYINKYIIGSFYEGKGTYLGISKGVHKFERHTKPFYQKQKFGPRYHFEKV